MSTLRTIPKELTVEQARSLVSSREIVIGVSSKKVPDKREKLGYRPEVTTVHIKQASEMKPELVMHGPTRRGEVDCYLGIDARRHYFDAKTGAAIGSELRLPPPEPPEDSTARRLGR